MTNLKHTPKTRAIVTAAQPAAARKAKKIGAVEEVVGKTRSEALAKKVPKASAKATPAKSAAEPKLVRDSFTIPKAEYAVLAELKQRSVTLGAPAKKSEVLRAGIKALAGMGDAAFAAALGTVPPLKTGRPAKA